MRKIKTLLFSSIIVMLVSSCEKEDINSPFIGSASDLAGTKWHIYLYRDASSSVPQTRNDTLTFSDATHYKYNNQSYTYYLNINDYTHLTLRSTSFGDIDGTLPKNFVQNGEILAVPFSQLQPSGGLTYYLWMKKF